MKIDFGFVFAILVITLTSGCLAMPMPEIRMKLDKLFSTNPKDAMTLEDANNLVMKVGSMRDERERADNSVDDATYDVICKLYYINMEQVCDNYSLEKLVQLESKFQNHPNVMLVLVRPRIQLETKCQQLFMERIEPDNYVNENPIEWQVLSKIVHSSEPNLVHWAANSEQLFSALRRTVTQTLNSLDGFKNLFEWLIIENNLKLFRANLCTAKTGVFGIGPWVFGEYLSFDRKKSFLSGLSGEQEDILIRSLICGWLEQVKDYTTWDSYIASQKSAQQLNEMLLQQELTPIEVHMILRVLSKYDQVSEVIPSVELEKMKIFADSLLLPFDNPQCSIEELNKVNGLKSMVEWPNNSIKNYHQSYIPSYMKACKGKFPRTKWYQIGH